MFQDNKPQDQGTCQPNIGRAITNSEGDDVKRKGSGASSEEGLRVGVII